MSSVYLFPKNDLEDDIGLSSDWLYSTICLALKEIVRRTYSEQTIYIVDFRLAESFSRGKSVEKG